MYKKKLRICQVKKFTFLFLFRNNQQIYRESITIYMTIILYQDIVLLLSVSS